MYYLEDGTPVNRTPQKALANVEARIRRLGDASEDDPSLLAERDSLQRQIDQETIRRYEVLHARYQEYRTGVPRLETEMKAQAPAYCKAVHRERRRYDAQNSVENAEGAHAA